MYHILPESNNSLISIKIINDFTSEDYVTLFGFIDKLIRKHGMIRVVLDLSEFKHILFWTNVKTLMRILRASKYIEKEAIISDENWIHTQAKFAAAFMQTNVHLFYNTEINDAWEWIKQ